MPDSAISIPDSAGTARNVDTRTTPGGDHREVVVLGDDSDRVVTVTSDNRLAVKMDFSATPVVTSVAISATSVTLIAADATSGRMGVTLYNDTGQIAYVRYGAEAAVIAPAAPTGGFSLEIPPGGYWESPRNYVHALTCIWPSTTGGGAMRVSTF
jgi:hypothetical protein